MTTILIAAALVLVKSLYAFVLSRKPLAKLQPDGTWVLVLIGVGLCILAAGIDRRLTNPSVAVFERRVWFFLLVGGVPIAVWQIARTAHALSLWFERVIGGIYGYPPENPSTLADQPGTPAHPDDRVG